jgi:hypothetical protein
MNKDIKVRWTWLKIMYYYTIFGAGSVGLGMIIIPERIISWLNFPVQDPIAFGIIASVYSAFAALSILGLRSPLKFAPVLLLQVSYKTIWFVAIIIPHLLGGTLPAHAWLTVVIFASYIIGDLIAIPFGYVFSRDVS